MHLKLPVVPDARAVCLWLLEHLSCENWEWIRKGGAKLNRGTRDAGIYQQQMRYKTYFLCTLL